jgi:pimeloyl-ACP methyl ester carboxylesterase
MRQPFAPCVTIPGVTGPGAIVAGKDDRRDRPTASPRYRGGSGEPLVLLHGGGGGTWRLWRTAIERLEGRFEVLAPTLAGHWGGPQLPPDRQGVDGLADAVEREMDEAGFETAHVAGGSLGGWVTLELARRGRARTAVVIAPAVGWEGGNLAWHTVGWAYRLFVAVAKLMARRPERWSRSPRVRRLLYWHHFKHPERMDPDDCAHMIVGAANFTGLGGGIEWARKHGAATALDEIRCPVLLAFPETDYVLPRRFFGERVVAGIPHAEVVDLPGVGHAAMVDDPDLVARTIADFTTPAQRPGPKSAYRPA